MRSCCKWLSYEGERWWLGAVDFSRFLGRLSAGSVGTWLEDQTGVKQERQAGLSAGVQA
jgi:hypothetical protein